mmetsp:Transcript_30763/g.62365  ORF Transcript_30763/g.62365 Transcript_30763/m.62365 type:complete len:461 (-) Transcript_30763:2412-3794(-)
MFRRIISGFGGEPDDEHETRSPSTPVAPSKIYISAHFVFLAHGFMGNHKELAFLEEAIKEAVADAKSQERDVKYSDFDVVVYRVQCNNTSTFDGIEAGGRRLAKEVQDFIKAYVAERRKNGTLPVGADDDSVDVHATISFFGYSLGGLYCRYAISLLPLNFEHLESNTSITLHPNTFCTAATPHLGIASHTYFILPRCFEYMLACALGKTGKDLFRVERRKRRQCCQCRGTMENVGGANDLVYAMSTQELYLTPLSTFKRRISIINAFGTDFQVPTATAGMLSLHSSSLHYLSDESGKWDIGDIDALVFKTEQTRRTSGMKYSGTVSRKSDEALTMALSLDSLGWTKIFVDCRKGMRCPGIPLPRLCRRPRKEMIDSLIVKRRPSASQSGNTKSGSVVFESKELCHLMRKSEQLHLIPTGHFVLVAHSKTPRGSKMSAKGRPFVRQAAVDLVNDMKTFQA